MSRRGALFSVAIVLTLVLSACGGAASPTQAPAATTSYKLAAIFPGSITDGDYNTLGYVGATQVQTDLGVSMAYSENVAVPDVERVMREYVNDGYNIIFTHGGQFASQTQSLAEEFPDVSFIAESDAPIDNAP
ncbi:MAG: BMP family ABC transporter substrate-binding protein, partial [Anaerolineales bacterium]